MKTDELRAVASTSFVRRPLADGEQYEFPGYPNHGFVCKTMSFPGTSSDDGGLPGVLVQWLNRARESFWYPFRTEIEFWKDIRFFNAVSPPNVKEQRPAAKEIEP